MPIGPGYFWKGLADAQSSYLDREFKGQQASLDRLGEARRLEGNLWDNALSRASAEQGRKDSIEAKKEVARSYAGARTRQANHNSMYNAELAAIKNIDDSLTTLAEAFNSGDPKIVAQVSALNRRRASHVARANAIASASNISMPVEEKRKSFFDKLNDLRASSAIPPHLLAPAEVKVEHLAPGMKPLNAVKKNNRKAVNAALDEAYLDENGGYVDGGLEPVGF